MRTVGWNRTSASSRTTAGMVLAVRRDVLCGLRVLSGERRSRGVAMLMVVLVLAALVAIATPFALSMGLHERKARSFRDTTRARLAAEGAVAHAITVLRRTEDHAERTRAYGPPWVTPRRLREVRHRGSQAPQDGPHPLRRSARRRLVGPGRGRTGQDQRPLRPAGGDRLPGGLRDARAGPGPRRPAHAA